ncbi:tetratricopeptide repeat protein [Flavobacterium sp.]|jgi:tetratricopeptide (TPR) repeat protein|uniref:tetratricopeptide repeat protein n=1 Tax=Flavobacterium sp. TaxID=239 RepID=UPI002A81F576|nr:tetratricopeptide repeat protein [Flavobacterium sp.]
MEKITVALVLFITSLIFGQNKDQNLYEGTTAFEGKEYVKSESNLRVSQSNNADKKAVANYNLGNSIYRQNQPSEAKYKFASAVEVAKTKEEKHKAYHNLGNTFMLEKNYQGAVDAYKNALRNNPLDDETRYNYALAKKKQKENPPKDDKKKDKDKDKDKKDKDQKDKDKKDQDKKDEGKDKKDDKKNGDDKKDKGDKGDDDKKEQPNPKPSGANKQQIENLLNAVNNSEQKIQDKINAKKVKTSPATNEKDW